ncbi:MAG: hypothetical protein AABY22_11145 [Nanoarchaeota archaeon]
MTGVINKDRRALFFDNDKNEIPKGKELFYIENTLVPVMDGSRIIGPLTAERLEQKREMYESVVRPEERDKFPFIVYKLLRVE